MFKFKETILMLCLFFSGALCYAHGVAVTENKTGKGPILTKLKAHYGGTDKSESIVASIDGSQASCRTI